MLYAPDAIDVSLSFKLKLLCLNKEANFEAVVRGMTSSLKREFKGCEKFALKEID